MRIYYLVFLTIGKNSFIFVSTYRARAEESSGALGVTCTCPVEVCAAGAVILISAYTVNKLVSFSRRVISRGGVINMNRSVAKHVFYVKWVTYLSGR